MIVVHRRFSLFYLQVLIINIKDELKPPNPLTPTTARKIRAMYKIHNYTVFNNVDKVDW